jgi:2,5-diketo-D-gluconate reductase B
VDLLLIHWPNPEIPLAETLDAMREQQEEGLATHLGVSNFPVALLERALEQAEVVCNQVEYHPLLDQSALLAACREHDVALTAYSPLAKGAALRDPAIRGIAEAHGVEPAQVVLRWLVDQPNVAAVPKSGTHARRRSNLDLWSFELTDADRARLDGLARPDGRRIDPAWSPDWD